MQHEQLEIVLQRIVNTAQDLQSKYYEIAGLSAYVQHTPDPKADKMIADKKDEYLSLIEQLEEHTSEAKDLMG